LLRYATAARLQASTILWLGRDPLLDPESTVTLPPRDTQNPQELSSWFLEKKQAVRPSASWSLACKKYLQAVAFFIVFRDSLRLIISRRAAFSSRSIAIIFHRLRLVVCVVSDVAVVCILSDRGIKVNRFFEKDMEVFLFAILRGQPCSVAAALCCFVVRFGNLSRRYSAFL